jgi:hypothetical protein
LGFVKLRDVSLNRESAHYSIINDVIGR